jgi:hypothetical protein
LLGGRSWGRFLVLGAKRRIFDLKFQRGRGPREWRWSWLVAAGQQRGETKTPPSALGLMGGAFLESAAVGGG